MHYHAIRTQITKHAFSELFLPSLSEIIPLSGSLSWAKDYSQLVVWCSWRRERRWECSEQNHEFYNRSTLLKVYYLQKVLYFKCLFADWKLNCSLNQCFCELVLNLRTQTDHTHHFLSHKAFPVFSFNSNINSINIQNKRKSMQVFLYFPFFV